MTPIYVDTQIYNTPPADGCRLPKEMKVYSLLEHLQIPYTRADHEHADTIEDCQAVEQLLDVKICKNLFLRNRQATDFYLLLMPGDKRFLTRELSHQLEISRLSFAEPEYMEKYLDITPGSVSVLGLMNDDTHAVRLVIDEDLTGDEFIGCHPCINTSTLKISLRDLLDKFLPETGHTFRIVSLTGGEA